MNIAPPASDLGEENKGGNKVKFNFWHRISIGAVHLKCDTYIPMHESYPNTSARSPCPRPEYTQNISGAPANVSKSSTSSVKIAYLACYHHTIEGRVFQAKIARE